MKSFAAGMSVMGQERTLSALDFMSAFGCKADVIAGKADIGESMSGFDPITSAITPKADISGRSANVRY